MTTSSTNTGSGQPALVFSALQLSELYSLVARVEAGTGVDNKLDAAIEALLYHAGLHAYNELDRVPAFTSSVDAALRLLADALPGYRAALYTNGQGQGPSCILMVGSEPVKAACQGSSLPRALATAILAVLANG